MTKPVIREAHDASRSLREMLAGILERERQYDERQRTMAAEKGLRLRTCAEELGNHKRIASQTIAFFAERDREREIADQLRRAAAERHKDSVAAFTKPYGLRQMYSASMFLKTHYS